MTSNTTIKPGDTVKVRAEYATARLKPGFVCTVLRTFHKDSQDYVVIDRCGDCLDMARCDSSHEYYIHRFFVIQQEDPQVLSEEDKKSAKSLIHPSEALAFMRREK